MSKYEMAFVAGEYKPWFQVIWNSKLQVWQYKKTKHGKHFGNFKTPQEADEASKQAYKEMMEASNGS